VFDEIMTLNLKTRKDWKLKEILHKSPSTRLFRNESHRLLSPADARGSFIAALRVRHSY